MVAEAAGVAELLRALTALNIVCVACFFFRKLCNLLCYASCQRFPLPETWNLKIDGTERFFFRNFASVFFFSPKGSSLPPFWGITDHHAHHQLHRCPPPLHEPPKTFESEGGWPERPESEFTKFSGRSEAFGGNRKNALMHPLRAAKLVFGVPREFSLTPQGRDIFFAISERW